MIASPFSELIIELTNIFQATIEDVFYDLFHILAL